MEFRYLDFSENLLETVINENYKQPTLYIFPNRRSAREAQKILQPKWRLNQQIFLTMDQWLEDFFIPDKPYLKEEKRILAFYQSLSKAHKETLNIKGYFQSVKFANNFFHFWQEIRNNSISEQSINKVLSSTVNGTSWQKDLYLILKEARINYKIYLENEGYSDPILASEPQLVDHFFDKINIVIVNQFYFTGLEKTILRKYSNQIILYYQIPELAVNEDNLEIRLDFSAVHITKHQNHNIEIISGKSELDMIISFLEDLKKNPEITAIDFRPEDQSYYHLISNPVLAGSKNNFKQSNLYIILKLIYDILGNSHYIKDRDLLLIKWDLLLKLLNLGCSKELVSNYAAAEWGILMQQYHNLQEKNYLYIDLKGEFLNSCYFSAESKNIIHKILQIIKLFTTLKTPDDLLSIITQVEFLRIIQSEKYVNNPDFSEGFIQSVNDFSTINNVDLKINWDKLFPNNYQQPEGLACSIGILKLFLDYLKPKNIENRNSKFSVKLTSLHNLRNLQIRETALLNLIEGILPPPPRQTFLFNENQRKELELITYDQVKLREKYYFLRTIATSQNVRIYTYNNLENNVEQSSFLEEIILSHNFKIETKQRKNRAQLISKIYEQILSNDSEITPNSNKIKEENFYQIPFEPENDLDDKTLPLTGYSSQEFIKDPWNYYLRFLNHLAPRCNKLEYDLSEKLIGIIAHDAFNKIWDRLSEVYEGNKIHHNFLFTNKNYVDRALEHIISKRNFIYLQPHNYSDIYFQNFFLPILRDGIRYFFYWIHNDLLLSDQQLRFFSESQETEIYNPASFKENGFSLKLAGRTDLIIKYKGETLIIDYKTGKESNIKNKKYFDQLIFYKLILNQNDTKTPVENQKMILYYIEEKRMINPSYRRTNPDQEFSEYKEVFNSACSNLIEKGFSLMEKKGNEEITPITRWDLYNKQVKNGTSNDS